MIYDVIYCGYDQYQSCVDELKAEYPNAMIEDASDSIHGGRFSIEVPDVKEEVFFLFLLRKGYLDISLKLGFLRLNSPEKFNDLLKMVIAERKRHAKEPANE